MGSWDNMGKAMSVACWKRAELRKPIWRARKMARRYSACSSGDRVRVEELTSEAVTLR